MSALTVLHFTDLGEDYGRLAVLTAFAQKHKEKLDAIFFTGDFLEGNLQKGREVTANKIKQKTGEYVAMDEFDAARNAVREFVHQYGQNNELNLEALGPEKKQEFQRLLEQEQQQHKVLAEKVKDVKFELGRDLVTIVKDSYKRLAAEFDKFPCKVYATLGNHDFTLGYDQFDNGKVVFVDKAPENPLTVDETPVIISKRGTTFIVKGDLNTWEVPPFYTDPAVRITLDNHFVNYSSGYSTAFIEQAIAQAQNDEERAGWRQQGGEMREYQREQRQRLGSPDKVDIYLTHKLPHNNEGRERVYGCVTGDITLEYSAKAKAVYGGHFHDGQIGKHSNLEKWLNEMLPKSTVKETVEGVEVPVIYLNDDEPWELNPGTQYFTITEFNEQKQVDVVTVYEFVYE